jgi:hypothetical protein
VVLSEPLERNTMIFGVTIVADEARIILLSGDKNNYQAISCNTKLTLPRGDESVNAILEFQKNFGMLLQNKSPDLVVVCEGGHDSKRKRIRMEFAVLSMCHVNSINYKTYASSAASKLIKSGYEKETGHNFTSDYEKLGLLKKDMDSFIVAWRYLE